MDKNDILIKVKQELSHRIDCLNYQTLEQYETEIKQFLEYLKLTNQLPIVEKSSEEEDKTQENRQVIEEEIKGNSSDELYLFERKIRGGMVIGLDGGYMIPEKMVRDMGVSHGDKLKIITRKQGYPRNLYWFEIAEKNNKEIPNRIEFKYCKVEREMGEHIVREYHGGDIRLDEVPFTFIIDKQDADTFELRDGDIVDIAFYQDNPIETMKVLYKYDLHEQVRLTVEQKKLTHPNKKSTIDMIEKESVINSKLFENKRVLIVGGGSRKTEYLEALKKTGAQVELATGDEDKTRLSSMIARTDVVAITIGECSHDASMYTVSECKKMDKAFSWTDRNGIQSLLLCVEEALKRNEKMAS